MHWQPCCNVKKTHLNQVLNAARLNDFKGQYRKLSKNILVRGREIPSLSQMGCLIVLIASAALLITTAAEPEKSQEITTKAIDTNEDPSTSTTTTTTVAYPSTTTAFDALISNGNSMQLDGSSILSLTTTTNQPNENGIDGVDYDSHSYNLLELTTAPSKPVEPSGVSTSILNGDSLASDEGSYEPIDGGSSLSATAEPHNSGEESGVITLSDIDESVNLLPSPPLKDESLETQSNLVRNKKASEKPATDEHSQKQQMSFLDSILQFSKDTLFAGRPSNSTTSNSNNKSPSLDYDDFDLDYQLKSNLSSSDNNQQEQESDNKLRVSKQLASFQQVRALPQAEPPSWSALIKEPNVFNSVQVQAGTMNKTSRGVPGGGHQLMIPSILTVKSTQLTSQELDKIRMLYGDDFLMDNLGQSVAAGGSQAASQTGQENYEQQHYASNGDLWATASNSAPPGAPSQMTGNTVEFPENKTQDSVVDGSHANMINLINGSPTARHRQINGMEVNTSSSNNEEGNYNSSVTTIVVDNLQPTELPPYHPSSTTASTLSTTTSMLTSTPQSVNQNVTPSSSRASNETRQGGSRSNQWFNYPNPTIHHNPLLLHHILNKPSLYSKHVGDSTSTTTTIAPSSLIANSPIIPNPNQIQSKQASTGSSGNAFDSPVASNVAIERPTFGADRISNNHINRTQLQMQLDEMRAIAAGRSQQDLRSKQSQSQVSLSANDMQAILASQLKRQPTSITANGDHQNQSIMSSLVGSASKIESLKMIPSYPINAPGSLTSQPLMMLKSLPMGPPVNSMNNQMRKQQQQKSMMAAPSLTQEVYTPQPSFIHPQAPNRGENQIKSSGLSEEDMSTYVAHLAALNSTPQSLSPDASSFSSSLNMSNHQPEEVQKFFHLTSGDNMELNPEQHPAVKLIELPEEVQAQIYRNFLGPLLKTQQTNRPISPMRLANPPYSNLDFVKAQQQVVAPVVTSQAGLAMIDSGSNQPRTFASLPANTTPVRQDHFRLENNLHNQKQQQQYQNQQRIKQLAFIEALKSSLTRLHNSKLNLDSMQQMANTNSGVRVRPPPNSTNLDSNKLINSFRMAGSVRNETSARQPPVGSPVMSVNDFDENILTGADKPAIPAWLEQQILHESIVHESATRLNPSVSRRPESFLVPPGGPLHISATQSQPIRVLPLDYSSQQHSNFRPNIDQHRVKHLYPIHPSQLMRPIQQHQFRPPPHPIFRAPSGLMAEGSQPPVALQAPPLRLNVAGFDTDPTRLLANRFPLTSAPAYLVRLPTLSGGTITASGTLTPPPTRFLLRHPVTGPLRLLAHSFAPGPAPIPPIPILDSSAGLVTAIPSPPPRIRLLSAPSSASVHYQPMPAYYPGYFALPPAPNQQHPFGSIRPIGFQQHGEHQQFAPQQTTLAGGPLSTLSSEFTSNSSSQANQYANHDDPDGQQQRLNPNHPLTRLQQATASLVELTSLASLVEEIASQTGDADTSPALSLANAINSLQQQQQRPRQVAMNAQASTTTEQQQQQQQQQQFSWRNLINQAVWRDKTYNKMKDLERLIASAAARRPLAGGSPTQARLKVKYIRVPVAVYEPISGSTLGGDPTSAILVPRERELMTKTQLAEIVDANNSGQQQSKSSSSSLVAGEIVSPNSSSHQQQPIRSSPVSTDNGASNHGQLSIPAAAAGSSASASMISNDYLFDEISSDSAPQLVSTLRGEKDCHHEHHPANDLARFNTLGQQQADLMGPLESALYYSLLSSPPGAGMMAAPTSSSISGNVVPASSTGDKKSKDLKRARRKKKKKKGKKGDDGDGNHDDENDEDDDEDDSILSSDDLPIIESIISSIVHGGPSTPPYPYYYPPAPGGLYMGGGVPHPGPTGSGPGSRLPWRSRGGGLRAEASGTVANYALPAGGHLGLGPFNMKHRLTLGEVVGAIGAKRLIKSLFSSKKERVKPGKRVLANRRKYNNRKGSVSAEGDLENRSSSTTTTTTTSTTSTTTSLPPTAKRKQIIEKINLNRPSVIKDLKGTSKNSSTTGNTKKQARPESNFNEVQYNFYLDNQPYENSNNNNNKTEDHLDISKRVAMPLYHIVADHYSKFHPGSTTQLAHQTQHSIYDLNRYKRPPAAESKKFQAQA